MSEHCISDYYYTGYTSSIGPLAKKIMYLRSTFVMLHGDLWNKNRSHMQLEVKTSRPQWPPETSSKGNLDT